MVFDDDDIPNPPTDDQDKDQDQDQGEVPSESDQENKDTTNDVTLNHTNETIDDDDQSEEKKPESEDDLTQEQELSTDDDQSQDSSENSTDAKLFDEDNQDPSIDTTIQEEINQGSENADDLLALAWEQSLSNSQNIDLDVLLNGGKSEDLRDLDQNEIDNLLGFADKGKSNKELHGIDAILNKTLIYYERLPMMEVVFDRLIRLLSTSLRNFTSDNVEISLESMKSTRFGDYLNSIPLPAMLGVFKAIEWDNQGLVVVDSSLIYSIVDVLLGGRRSITATRVEGRPYTTIERNLIEKLMNVFLDDLKTAFEPVSPINFSFERLEINPHFAMIARAANAGILVKLHVEIDDRGGRLNLMLPYATIEPIRELLLQNFMGEKFGRDSIWEQHLASELWETDVEFDIHLAHTILPLGDVLNWKPGDQVQFSITPSSLVSAVSGDHELFKGMVGHKNGKVAVRVEDNLIYNEAIKHLELETKGTTP